MRKTILILLTLATLGAAILEVYGLPHNGLTPYERWSEMRSGKIYRSGPTSSRAIALTFDDGPDPRYTPAVLDILKRHDIKATFFVCGNMLQRNPNLGKRIVAEGHVVGNHTMTHSHLERLKGAAATHEISDCERQIEQVLGERSHLFRPPRGLWNSTEFKSASRGGFTMVLWSLAFDREAIHDSTKLRNRVVRLAKPGDIILLHDGSYGSRDIRRSTVRELETLIVQLKRKGFRFETIPTLLHVEGDEPVTALPPGKVALLE